MPELYRIFFHIFIHFILTCLSPIKDDYNADLNVRITFWISAAWQNIYCLGHKADSGHHDQRGRDLFSNQNSFHNLQIHGQWGTLKWQTYWQWIWQPQNLPKKQSIKDGKCIKHLHFINILFIVRKKWHKPNTLFYMRENKQYGKSPVRPLSQAVFSISN